MKDVFLSYASADRPKAALIERALVAAGFSVFWDQEVPPGRDWDTWIREHLTGAKVAVVLWSKASVASSNVKHEAMIAKESGKLIPALVEALSPSDFPMGMYLTQAAVLTDFHGGDHPGMRTLLAEVAARLGAGARPASLSATPSSKPSRGVLRWLGAAFAIAGVAVAAFAVLDRPAFCDVTGLLCEDASADPTTETAPAAAPADAPAATQDAPPDGEPKPPA